MITYFPKLTYENKVQLTILTHALNYLKKCILTISLINDNTNNEKYSLIFFSSENYNTGILVLS